MNSRAALLLALAALAMGGCGTGVFIQQPSVNRAALPLISAELREDPTIYPPREVMSRLTPLRARSHEQSRLETRLWTCFRTGQ